MNTRDRIEITVSDITRLRVDAVVNAANQRMLGGGGVDGAIHRAAGPELLHACRAIPEIEPGVRCPVGEARITPAFELPAQYIIHTVGPVWHGGHLDEPLHLANCYRNALALAAEHGLTTLAFPAISTGVYSYPKPEAAHIAVETVRECLGTHTTLRRITFCCFADEDAHHYHAILEADNETAR